MPSTLPSVTHAHKLEITRGNVTPRNVQSMAKYVEDPQLREEMARSAAPGERLKWARLYWQHQNGIESRTAKQAAEALVWKRVPIGPTNGLTPPRSTRLCRISAPLRFGRKFKVSWTWILLNHGEPFDQVLGPAQERVLRIMSGAADDQQETIADMIEAYLNAQSQRQRQAQR